VERAEPQRPEPASAPDEKAEPDDVDVRPADLDAIRREVARHRGKVVLLDFWATWCVPCVQAWPKLVGWQEEHGDALAIVTVSVDDLSDRDGGVAEFLRKRGAPFTALILDVVDYDAFVKEMGGEWGGGVPGAFLYDRSGDLLGVYQGADAAGDLEADLAKLLAAPD
jgi:thiol-disulfide isomerase/thioredoxin